MYQSKYSEKYSVLELKMYVVIQHNQNDNDKKW